jgi:hypothetical protein
MMAATARDLLLLFHTRNRARWRPDLQPDTVSIVARTAVLFRRTTLPPTSVAAHLWDRCVHATALFLCATAEWSWSRCIWRGSNRLSHAGGMENKGKLNLAA